MLVDEGPHTSEAGIAIEDGPAVPFQRKGASKRFSAKNQGELVLGEPIERQPGQAEVVDSEAMFLRLLDQYRKARLLP